MGAVLHFSWTPHGHREDAALPLTCVTDTAVAQYSRDSDTDSQTQTD